MKLINNFGHVLHTEKHLARETENIAATHFPADQREIAKCVISSLVSVLCVNIEQIAPQTDIVKDLGADENWEWQMIFLHLEDALGFKFSISSRFCGRTVADLVDFVSKRASQHGSQFTR